MRLSNRSATRPLAGRRTDARRGAARLTVYALALGLVLGAAPVAAAKSGDRVFTGACTGASTWKLKLGNENGRISTELEIDQNRVGRVWTVAITDNGTTIFRGARTTTAPSGSFSVRRITTNRVGTDRFIAVARASATGEVCRARGTF
jgi:hypothetical protein